MTEQEFLAEIKNSFKSYDEAGLIDEITIFNRLVGELKRFGNNITEYKDDVLIVKHGKATLPKDFWKLRGIYKIHPQGVECSEEGVIDRFQDSHFWTQITKEEVKTKDGKVEEIQREYSVKEERFFRDKTATLFYNRPTRLYLGRNYSRNSIAKGFTDIHPTISERGNQNTVSLRNRTIFTEFKEGHIYIKYQALPTDDNGDIVIPETQHDRLKEYLIAHAKWKVLEDMLLNNDDPHVVNKIGYFQQQAQESFGLAMTETKESTLTKDTFTKIKNNQKRYSRVVSSLFPQI